MKKLIDPKNTTALMKELGLSAKKRYGQNFLIDEKVLKRILEGAKIGPEDTVLEIGPGIGTLTQALSGAAGKVVAVEIDRELIPVLERTLADCPNVEIINEDILKVDIKTICENAGGPVKVVANLPYYITTPIIMKLLEEELPLESITVMVQKEVAERMQALPGGKDYGALTLAVNYYSLPEIITKAPANCFLPRPNVDSAVIRLTLHKERPVICEDPEFLFRVIKAAFSQRRKKLSNTLLQDAFIAEKLRRSAGNGDLPEEEGTENAARLRDKLEAMLTDMGLPADVRGERLSLLQFAELSGRLLNCGGKAERT